MKFKILLFIIFTLSLAITNFAQEINELEKESKSTFSLDGEFRNRFELSPSVAGRNVIVSENTQSGVSFWQRSRITGTYKNDKFESKFSFQDVRPFVSNFKGLESSNGAAFSIHEAWAKYYFVNNENTTVGIKIGRQELLNSDARIIWNKDWTHYGSAVDAFSLEYDNKDLDLKWNLSFSLNSAELPGTALNYRTLGLFTLAKKFGRNVTINITDFTEGFDEESHLTEANYVRNIIGFNPVINVSRFKFNGSFYYQHGTPNTFVGTNPNPDKYAALMYTVNLSYKMDKYSFGIGYDNYSGEAYDDNQTDYKNKVFTTPCYGGHKFFGNTDFHLKLFGKERGLQDINLKVNAAVNKKTNLTLAFHNIAFAEMNVYTEANGNDVEFTAVGNNVDFVLERVLGEKMALLVGYSIMLPADDYVSYSLGNDVISKFHGWEWLMFSFKPNFLKAEK